MSGTVVNTKKEIPFKKSVKKRVSEKYPIVVGGIVLLFFTFLIYGAMGGGDDEKISERVIITNRDLRAQIEEMEKTRHRELEKEGRINDDVFLGNKITVSEMATDIISGLEERKEQKAAEDEKDIFGQKQDDSIDESENNFDDPFADFDMENSLNETHIGKNRRKENGSISEKRVESGKRKVTMVAFSDRDINARVYSNNGRKISGNNRGITKSRQTVDANKKNDEDGKDDNGGLKLIYNNNPVLRIFEGDFLEAVLINSIENDVLKSPVMCRVVKDFFDGNGTYILVPSNTRLIGSAIPVSGEQSDRLIIRFHRMIFPNDVSLHIDSEKGEMLAINSSGVLGMRGKVRRHLARKYGAAVFYGFLNGLGGFAQNRISQRSGTSFMIGRSSENLEQLNNRIYSGNMSVVPTISLKAGTPLKIYLSTDIKISAYIKIKERSYTDWN